MKDQKPLSNCPFCGAEAYYEFDFDGEFAVDHKPGCYLTGHRKISLNGSWNQRALPSKGMVEKDLPGVYSTSKGELFTAKEGSLEKIHASKEKMKCAGCDEMIPKYGSYRYCWNCLDIITEKELIARKELLDEKLPKEGSNEEEIKSSLRFLLDNATENPLGREAAIHGTYLRIAELSPNPAHIVEEKKMVALSREELFKEVSVFFHESQFGNLTLAINRICLKFWTPAVLSEDDIMDILCPPWREQDYVPYKIIKICIENDRKKAKAIRSLILNGRGE